MRRHRAPLGVPVAREQLGVLRFEVVISRGCMAVEWRAREVFDAAEVQAVADKLLADCIALADGTYLRAVGAS